MYKMWLTLVLAAAAVGLAAAPATAQIRSSFDGGTEGWSIVGEQAMPSWVSTGGNPGGFLRARDPGTGTYMFFNAPRAFLGDRSPYADGSLSFDLRSDSAFVESGTDDVQLHGAGRVLAFDLAPLGETGTWHRVSVPLVPVGWRLAGGVAATEADILAVMSDLQALRIRAEWTSGFDVDDLDNVELLAPPRPVVDLELIDAQVTNPVVVRGDAVPIVVQAGHSEAISVPAVVRVELPEGLVFERAFSRADGRAVSCVEEPARRLACSVGRIDAQNPTRTVEIQTRASQHGDHLIAVSVDGPESQDPDPSDNSATRQLRVHPPTVDLSVQAQGPSTPLVRGDIAEIPVQLRLFTDRPVTVRLTVATPPGLHLMSVVRAGAEAAEFCPEGVCTFRLDRDLGLSVKVRAVADGDHTIGFRVDSPDSVDGATANDTSSARVDVVPPSADLAIIETPPVAAMAGDDVDVWTTVRNRGPHTTAATLRVTPGAGLALVSVTDSDGRALNCAPTCDLGTFPAHDLGVRVRLTALEAGTRTLAMRVDGRDSTDPVPDDNARAIRLDVSNRSTDLAVATMTQLPDPVVQGDTTRLTATVRNEGPGPATPLVTVRVSSLLTDLTPSAASGLTCAAPQRDVTSWLVTCRSTALLGPGATAGHSWTAETTQVGSYGWRVEVAPELATELDPADNARSQGGTVRQGRTDLRVRAAAPSTATVGSPMNYTVWTANAGQETAYRATLSYTLPDGAAFRSASDHCTYTSSVRRVSCPMNPKATTREQQHTIRVTPTVRGQLAGAFQVTSAAAETKANDNRATVSTKVGT